MKTARHARHGCQRCQDRMYGTKPCPACGKVPLAPPPRMPSRNLPKGQHKQAKKNPSRRPMYRSPIS